MRKDNKNSQRLPDGLVAACESKRKLYGASKTTLAMQLGCTASHYTKLTNGYFTHVSALLLARLAAYAGWASWASTGE